MQIKNRQQLLIIVAGVAFGLLLGDSLVFSPLVKLWKSRSTRIVDLGQKVRNGEELLRRETILQSRWNHMQASTLTNSPSMAEQQILADLRAGAGKPVDVGGYYHPDAAKCARALRPSATFNAALAQL